MANNRKPGFYWVRYKEWIVAEWDGINWSVIHNCANYDDNDWAEINECALAEPLNELSNCNIHSVSNQRELLLAFCKFCENIEVDWAKEFECWIDDFLSKQ